jgi:uncharacterized membrane protein
MPFCVQCGNQVRDTDRFCKVCGGAQTPAQGFPASTPPLRARASDPFAQLTPRNASLLCYIPMVGWVASIVILASTRFRNDPEVRFNAFQGLYIFVAWLIIDWVVSPFLMVPYAFDGFGPRHFFPGLLKAAMIGVWIFMIVKVSQGESYRLPILGELADRSVSEQR